VHRDQPGQEDTQEPEQSAQRGVVPKVRSRQGAQVNGEVEVGPGEGLDERQADEEVARGDPAFEDDVFAEEGNDDGPAAKDDGSG
jgi:hypothetical protein